MTEEEEGIVEDRMIKCWNCDRVVYQTDMQHMLAHSCFHNYNENDHAIKISDDGVISISTLSAKKKKVIQIEKLINSVKKRPALYDKNVRNSVSLDDKVKIWNEVGSDVSPDFSGEAARNKWKSLRDQYTRVLSNQRSSSFRYYGLMQFLDNHSSENERLPLHEIAENIEELPSKPSKNTILLKKKRPAESDIHEGPERRCCDAPERASTHAASQHAGETASIVSDEFTEGSSQSANMPSTSTTVKRRADARGRKYSNKDAAKMKKEELQMLVLEKIRSHKVEKAQPTDLFLLSLADTFKQLEHKRKLRVHRRFIEILEEEYNEQEYERAHRDNN